MGNVVYVRAPEAPGGVGVSCAIQEGRCGPVFLVTVHGPTQRARLLFHDADEVATFADGIVAGRFPDATRSGSGA
ncbi:hypothetical protein [Tranquillimonas alkanivorans]|uniref:Uncharacterized protein n=1 Tax=Tranquillimonas alkanivorans TaxID=441119 RepID=A0A1I5PMM2_9RHOB|nr:hypothetical protein [Tranquillimonas alkanivorans]SFP35372.1 hypothetical protein SAMN04488047_105175 [Tranquillimonas alkanivorans]